jgi:phosphohistidine swiveling domain-containing protein
LIRTVATVALADRAARDPALVGVKAAQLAAATGAGLPVLPGWVIPLEASSDAVARGVGVLEGRSGGPAAYLAAMESAMPVDLAEELFLRAASEDRLLVVRSSTLLDDDGRWSGAFTSYLGVGASDLATAVRGCWASGFSTDALARCRETGIEVETLRIGVLVQPFLAFEVGGTARVLRDGTVVVTAAPGGPAGVVGGRGGLEVIVGVDRRVLEALEGAIRASTVDAAAALARRAVEVFGAGVIEWGAMGDDISLLQVGRTPPERAAVARPSRPVTIPVRIPAEAERLARLVTAFPGPLGDDLVLPWSLGSGDVPEAERIEVDDPGSALREARATGSELAAEVWKTSSAGAQERAAAVSRLLLEGRVVEACHEIRDLAGPDTAAARRVVGLLLGVGAFLADARVLPSALLVWRLTVSEIERAVAGDRPSLRRGPGRWEPFVADVVRSRGLHASGTPVSPGIGAGRHFPLRGLRGMGRPGPREVLVTPLPLPHLAPLLWHSAAVVSIGGSSGAHLFEVARSLGVPAVIGVDPSASGGGVGSLVAVDGDSGVVSILPPGGTPSLPSHDDAQAMV